MIIVNEIANLEQWLQENRPDKESKKPYFLSKENNGAFELPEEELIEKGLIELKQPYKVVREIKGISVELDSDYF